MSSGKINEIEENLNQLRLERVDFDRNTEKSSVNNQQNISSLDAYNKSLHCKSVENSFLNVVIDGRYSFISKRRLQNELKQFNISSAAGISAHLKEDNLFEWEASIQGPPGTPYEGGTFILDFSFPSRYPFRPPKVTFKTKIYHCNINSDGYISLNILGSQWVSSSTIEKIFLSIQSFFNDCNPDDCLVPEIAAKYVNDRKEHDRVCRKWTKKYATKEADF